MAKNEEQLIKRAILDWIRFQPRKGFAWSQYNGAVYSPVKKIFLKHSGYQRKGVPDIIGVWCTRPLFIEVKRPGGKLSAEQRYFLMEAQKHGAIAFVTNCLMEAAQVLDSFEMPSCVEVLPPLLRVPYTESSD